MGVRDLIELPEFLTIQYFSNIFSLTLSLFPKGRGKGEGRQLVLVTEKERLMSPEISLDLFLESL